MKDKTIRSFFLFFSLVFFVLHVQFVQANTPSQRLIELLSFSTMKASFVEKSGEGVQSGKVFLKKPGKFFWQVTKPYKQLMIANNERFFMYDSELNQVLKERLTSRSNTLAMLLSKSRQLDGFIVDESRTKRGLFILKPRGEAMFQRILLLFIDKKLELIKILDNFGNVTEITFSNVRLNVNLSDSLFEFKVPKGASVVE